MRRGRPAGKGARAAPRRARKVVGAGYLHGRMFYGKFLQDFKQDDGLDFTHVVQLALPPAAELPLAQAQATAAALGSSFSLRALQTTGLRLNVLRVKLPAAADAEALEAAARDLFAQHAQAGQLRGEFGPLKTFAQKKCNSFIFFEALRRGSLYGFAAALTRHVLATWHQGLFPDKYTADQLEVLDDPALAPTSLVAAPLYIPLLRFRLSQDDEGRLIERLLALDPNPPLGVLEFQPDIRVLSREAFLAERADEGKQPQRAQLAAGDPADPTSHAPRGRPRGRGGRGVVFGKAGRR